MATTTYTFAGITNPSATHRADKNESADLPPASGGQFGDTEATDAQYTALAASDDSYAIAISDEVHALWQFKFKIAEAPATITQLDLLCGASGSADSADGWRFYIRNHATPAWEQLDATTSGAEVTLTGPPITTNIANYIDGSGYVYLLAEQVGVYVCAPAGKSAMWVDFTRCVVTYTSVVAPTITISAATLITTISARLNGNVTATGGENPTVTCYWGLTDGGQTPGNWTNSSAPTSPGQPQGVASFYKDVAALDPGTLYWFSAKGTNSAGTGWPAASLSFTTERAYCQAQCVG